MAGAGGLGFTPQQFAYASMGIGLLGAIFALIGGGPLSLIGAIACGLGVVGAILFYKYGYILMPIILQRSRVVQILEGGYEIPPSNDAIIKNVGGIYYASMFLVAKIYESVSEKSPEETAIYTEFFERAISSVNFVVKFCMMVYVKDLNIYRTNLETKRAEAQLRLARERDKPDPDVLKLDRYEREVAMWEGQIARLTAGVKPMGALCYIMTTATGVSKEEAMAHARAQANELKATVSNALNVEVTLLKGEEMKKCFDWEYMIPPTAAEFEQQVV